MKHINYSGATWRSHLCQSVWYGKATMCAYTQYGRALPHWKCVLQWCYNCPCINISDQETDNHYSGTTPSIRFCVYHIIACCTDHGINPLKDKKMCRKCKQKSSIEKYTKIYTRKELVMMETAIYDFQTSFYIPSIQRFAFHLPHMRILGTNHCGKLQRTAFKRSWLFQDVLCCRDYAERVVASFSHKL